MSYPTHRSSGIAGSGSSASSPFRSHSVTVSHGRSTSGHVGGNAHTSTVNQQVHQHAQAHALYKPGVSAAQLASIIASLPSGSVHESSSFGSVTPVTDCIAPPVPHPSSLHSSSPPVIPSIDCYADFYPLPSAPGQCPEDCLDSRSIQHGYTAADTDPPRTSSTVEGEDPAEERNKRKRIRERVRKADDT